MPNIYEELDIIIEMGNEQLNLPKYDELVAQAQARRDNQWVLVDKRWKDSTKMYYMKPQWTTSKLEEAKAYKDELSAQLAANRIASHIWKPVQIKAVKAEQENKS